MPSLGRGVPRTGLPESLENRKWPNELMAERLLDRAAETGTMQERVTAADTRATQHLRALFPSLIESSARIRVPLPSSGGA
jgi:hypothetical protein